MTAKPSYEELERRIQELEKAESECNLAEDRLKKIFDNTHDAIFIHDLEGKILDVNDKMCRLYGLTKEEALEVSIEDVSSTRMSMKVLLERWQKVLNGEKLLFEWEALRPKDESVFNVEVSLQMLSFHDKDIILANVRDITERKRSEEALRESENQISSIFRSAPVGMGSVVNRMLIKVNNRLCEMTGYDETELIGQNARILYPSDEDFEFVGREKYAQIADHGTGIVETRWQKKDGTIMDVLLSSTSVNLKDHSEGVTFTALDNTERKLAEEALRNSETQKRAILDSSLDSIRLVDRDMRIIWTNKLIENQLQKTRKELIGDYCYHAYTGRNEPCPNCPTIKALKSGKTEHSIIIEENVKGMEGISYWADYAVPIKNESGEIFNFIQVSRDITDIKKAEKAMLEEKNKLAVALAKVKKLSGMLPICSYCKKIRDDKGYWNQIENYIHEHSEAEFSHSICQECAKKHYPGMGLHDDE